MGARWRGWMSREATGKFSSRWPLGDRASAGVIITAPLVGLHPSLPSSTLSSHILPRGIDSEERVLQGNKRKRQTPQRREPVESKRRLKSHEHRCPSGSANHARDTA